MIYGLLIGRNHGNAVIADLDGMGITFQSFLMLVGDNAMKYQMFVNRSSSPT